MNVTNIEEERLRKSPAAVIERRLAWIEKRREEIHGLQAALSKEGQDLFKERGELQAALTAVKRLVE